MPENTKNTQTKRYLPAAGAEKNRENQVFW